MRFWDSSALVALLADEQRSPDAGALLAADPELVSGWATRIECVSAIRRRQREGSIGTKAVELALSRLGLLAEAWFEVLPGEALRLTAERLLAVHPLRAGDALQLAAAIQWRGEAGTAELVCFDERLGDAAAREGFRVLP